MSDDRRLHQISHGSLNRRVVRLISFCLAVLLVWGLGALTYGGLQALLASTKTAEKAQEVRYQAEHLLSLLKDAETGQRGFIITGDESYLEPYQAALQAAPEILVRLRGLATDSERQNHRLKVLQPLVAERLAMIEVNIETRRNGSGLSFDRGRLDNGKALMDEIRAVISDIIQEETRLYRQQNMKAERDAKRFGILLLLGIAISTLAIGALFIATMWEVRRRRDAEMVLRGLNLELEQLVQARVAEVERNQRFLNAILQNMQDALFINKGGRIVFVNDACLRLFGARSREQILGRAPLEFFHEDYHLIIRERIRRLAEPGVRSPVIEERIIPLDGEPVDVEVTAASFIDEDDSVILVMLRDITERKASERQLQHANRMEAVGQLTGGIAHDFNNLLAVIIGNLDLLEEELRDRPKIQELAQMALEASLRGAALTRQLLAFSRRQTLTPQVLNLNDLVVRTTDLLRRTLGEGIRININPAQDLWPALADPAQVEAALTNLAINARDAMDGGGYLTIETANKHLDEQYASDNAEVAPGDYVMVAVTDSGTGIAPDVLARVFEPFFTTKEDGKGTGLGLSMVYGFAKQSRGHLKIYSELGHGTTVRLYLPRAIAPSSETAAVAGAEPAPAAEAATILVVEDQADVRRVVVQQLTELGYGVVEAENPALALDLLDRHEEISLLFTDVVMPGGMTGDQLAREARRRRPGLKVLFTSGFAEASMGNGGRSHDITPQNLLSKPYRKQDLARRIAAALTGGSG